MFINHLKDNIEEYAIITRIFKNSKIYGLYINNILEHGCNFSKLGKEKKTRLLFNSFDWYETKEGYLFWCNIYSLLYFKEKNDINRLIVLLNKYAHPQL